MMLDKMKQNFKNLNLDDLKSQIDIVSLIEEYGIDLEASGDNYVALCPFHPDNKTKSFLEKYLKKKAIPILVIIMLICMI